jgi:hypothetical protein
MESLVIDSLLSNIAHPPILFFFLGIFAVLMKSDLEIPPSIGKFFSIYLLFDIGLKGGEELFHSGFSIVVVKVMLICMALSFSVPWLLFKILRLKLDIPNSGAIAATYGSISAVTFATAVSFLSSEGISFGGYMVAGMALMESPAIVAGLLLIAINSKTASSDETGKKKIVWKKVLHEAFFNGSVLLLIGSLIIGYAGGQQGEEELAPFVNGIFVGMLSLYMLDMGLTAGSRLGALKESGVFLVSFALIYPIFGGALGIACAALIGLGVGDALLLAILAGSASYIAVPAAMRISVPKANMSLLLPMALGITFTFNVTVGIPLFYAVIQNLWGVS